MFALLHFVVLSLIARCNAAPATIVIIESSDPILSLPLVPPPPSDATAPPIVDLGYAVHQAVIGQSQTGTQYFNFSNIRYGEPPIGNLRFRAPVAASTVDRSIQIAPLDRVCPQGTAGWQAQAGSFIGSIIAGPNATIAGGTFNPNATSAPPPPPPVGASTGSQTEDCLFLDVMVPETVFNATEGKGAPVVVWIHGGGHVNGAKNLAGNPSGLIAESVANGRSGIVFVEINYRLGLFGYSPRRVGDADIASNAGLLDQRLAFAWVQQNIHLFGGDPSSITLMGESAGANSIMLHLTSFGGAAGNLGPLPFQKAILQSPAWRPTSDAAFYERLFDQVLQTANATSINDLRSMDTTTLQALNENIINGSPYEAFGFGTNIDGDYIPAAPSVLLSQGKFNSKVQIMVGHNTNEGLLFTDDTVNDQIAFEANLAGLLPGATSDQVTQLATQIYPEDFSGALPYSTQTERMSVALRDGVVESNAFALNTAFQNNTFSYTFGNFPGFHAQDLEYTFFLGTGSGQIDGLSNTPVNETVAGIMQNAFIQFAMTGNPNGGAPGLPDIPLYGPDNLVLFINNSVVAPVQDSASVGAGRQAFWNLALYNQTV